MRASLKGVLSRVNQLADRLCPSSERWDWAEIEHESDEELYARLMVLVRKAGNPDEAWRQAGLSCENNSVLAEVRERWKREQ
jgi:hypothetical protein